MELVDFEFTGWQYGKILVGTYEFNKFANFIHELMKFIMRIFFGCFLKFINMEFAGFRRAVDIFKFDGRFLGYINKNSIKSKI